MHCWPGDLSKSIPAPRLMSPGTHCSTLRDPETNSKHQAARSFLPSDARLMDLKASVSPKMIKRGSYPALVVNMHVHGYIYPNLCICRNTLTFCEKGVNVRELWKAFNWSVLCYSTINSTVWRRKLEWYLKLRNIFSESRGYYRRNRTFRYWNKVALKHNKQSTFLFPFFTHFDTMLQ